MKALSFLGIMGLGMTELVVVLIVVLMISLIPLIFYLLTLSNTLRLCANHNRKIEPGQMWLTLIPIFGTIWNFIMIGKIADTLESELRERNISSQEQRPGYNVGLAYAIFSCCGWIPYLGSLLSIGTLICWIIYWVRIANYKNILERAAVNLSFGNLNSNTHYPQQPYQGQNPYINQQQFPNQPPQNPGPPPVQ